MTALSGPIPVDNTVYAPRVKRWLGQVIDGFIAFAPFVFALTLTGATDGTSIPLAYVAIFWAIGYNFLADGLPGGQSFAKRLLGMKVVDAETRAPCSYVQSLLRNFLLWLLGPLDWVFIFGERHQRLGDKAAGTIVIDA